MMDTKQIKEMFDKYVVPNYTRNDVVLVKGEGSQAWDSDGKRYLDLFPGWGCDGLGHCHPRVVKAVREQAGKLIHVANNYYNELQGELACILSANSFGGKFFFCNSGAEANEGAIKFARIFTEPKRYKVITMHGSFHGRTLAAITATAQDKYHKGIGPLSPGFEYVPFNDIDAVAKTIDGETCAVLIEPIQGEGGVNVADEAYVGKLRDLCDGKNVLLIFDEVQTGCGRTGEFFAHKLYGVNPDIMTLAKALAGGLAMGAIGAKPEIADAIVPGLHASTFGGNPLACAAAIATFKAIEEDGLLEHTKAMGKHLRSRLRELAAGTGLINDVRGRGLMVGAELTVPGAPIVNTCMENGLLINCTHDTVIRFLPSMTVTAAELDEGLEIFAAALKKHGGEAQ
ncbi:MAG: aspartate aminotransferase family protein [Planctomycetota bacterium]